MISPPNPPEQSSGNDGLKCRKTAFMQVSAFILSNGSTLALFVWG